jgi:hypothetical protein
MQLSKPIAPEALTWRVARRCNGGACIRVASYSNIIVVSDSRGPASPFLAYSRDEWNQFVEAVRRGHFDGM